MGLLLLLALSGLQIAYFSWLYLDHSNMGSGLVLSFDFFVSRV